MVLLRTDRQCWSKQKQKEMRGHRSSSCFQGFQCVTMLIHQWLSLRWWNGVRNVWRLHFVVLNRRQGCQARFWSALWNLWIFLMSGRSISTFVRMTRPDVFKETSRQFPATFVATEVNILSSVLHPVHVCSTSAHDKHSCDTTLHLKFNLKLQH